MKKSERQRKKKRREALRKKTSNDIIAGNGRILKVYMFIVQLYII